MNVFCILESNNCYCHVLQKASAVSPFVINHRMHKKCFCKVFQKIAYTQKQKLHDAKTTLTVELENTKNFIDLYYCMKNYCLN